MLSHWVQLIALVRIAGEECLEEYGSFCQKVPKQTTQDDVYGVVTKYFKTNQMLQIMQAQQSLPWWEICDDRKVGRLSIVSAHHSTFSMPGMQVRHCFVHNELLSVVPL